MYAGTSLPNTIQKVIYVWSWMSQISCFQQIDVNIIMDKKIDFWLNSLAAPLDMSCCTPVEKTLIYIGHVASDRCPLSHPPSVCYTFTIPAFAWSHSVTPRWYNTWDCRFHHAFITWPWRHQSSSMNDVSSFHIR